MNENQNFQELITQARKHHQAGDLAAAQTIYQTLLEQVPEDLQAELHNNLATIYYKQSDFNAALKHYAAAVQLHPDYLQAHYNLGILLIKLENFAAASKQFNNVTQLDPTYWPAYQQIANCALRQNNYAQAIHAYQTVLVYQPQHIDALNNLGALWLKLGSYNEAIKCFATLLRFDENHLEAKQNLALTLLQQQRYQEALEHYQQLISKMPEESELYYNAGVASMQLGQFSIAISYFQQVLQHQPQHIPALTNLGTIYQETGSKQQAIAYYKNILDMQPENEIIRYQLAALEQNSIPDRPPATYIQNLFNNYATHYDGHMQKQLNYRIPSLILHALHKVTGQQHTFHHALDLGCGTGLCGEILRPIIQGKLIGVDLAGQMLAIAREKNIYDHLYEKDLVDWLKQADSGYDLIIAGDVLVYFGDLQSILEACHRILQSGGLCTFTYEHQTSEEPYLLTPSARYQHTPAYINELASHIGFNVDYHHKAVIRQQAGKAIDGGIVVLSK